MAKIDQLSAKVKELREGHLKHELHKEKVYKTKMGKWLDTSLGTCFSNWFKKTKNPWHVGNTTVLIGFGCLLLTSIIALIALTFNFGWLSLIGHVVGGVAAWKVCSIFNHTLHAWNCSLAWGDPTYYDDARGKLRFESIVSKDVFDAALDELKKKEPAAQDLIQTLRDNPLSAHDSQIVMNCLDNLWGISELSLFRKGAIKPDAVKIEHVERHPRIMESVRALRL